MSTERETAATTIGAEVTLCEEVPMVRRERWEEIRRLGVTERLPIAEIARRLDLDRKTVRRCLRDTTWQPYQRPPRPETLLAPMRVKDLGGGVLAEAQWPLDRQRGRDGDPREGQPSRASRGSPHEKRQTRGTASCRQPTCRA